MQLQLLTAVIASRTSHFKSAILVPSWCQFVWEKHNEGNPLHPRSYLDHLSAMGFDINPKLGDVCNGAGGVCMVESMVNLEPQGSSTFLLGIVCLILAAFLLGWAKTSIDCECECDSDTHWEDSTATYH